MTDNPVVESVRQDNDGFSFGPEDGAPSIFDEIMSGPPEDAEPADEQVDLDGIDDLIGEEPVGDEPEGSEQEAADEIEVVDNAPESEPDPLRHQTKKALSDSARYHQSRADKAEAELKRLMQRLEERAFSDSAAGTQKGNPDQVADKASGESRLPARPEPPKKPNSDDPFEQIEYLEARLEYQDAMTEYRLAEQQQRLAPDLQAIKTFQQQAEQERKVNEATATVTRMGLELGLDSNEATEFARDVVSGELQNNEQAWLAAWRSFRGKAQATGKPAATKPPARVPDTRERATSASAAKGDRPVEAKSFQERLLAEAESLKKPDLF